MQKPKALRRGDTVAVVSLSSGLAGESAFLHRYLLGKKRLEEEFRLRVVPMPNALKGIEYLYRNPAARAADFMQAFEDPSVHAVFSMIGGDDTIRLLPYIRWAALHQNPKIFMGYSDTTLNHLMLHRAGVVSFYGPAVLDGFAENGAMHPYTKHFVQKLLFDGAAGLSIPSSPRWTSQMLSWAEEANDAVHRAMQPEKHGYQLLQGSGTAEGPLFGGCVDVLPLAFGTPLWPAAKALHGVMLFLETSEAYPLPTQFTYLLRSLAAQGILQGLGGILVGKPKDETHFEAYKEVLLRVVGEECGLPHLPILYNLNFGHTAPQCVLPYGIRVRLNCTAKTLHLAESAVAAR